LEGNPVNFILPPFRSDEEDRAIYGLQLRQEIYTPKDLDRAEIQEGDHPYAATLSIGQVRMVNRPSNKLRYTSGLWVGVIGPAALGFNAQDFIHRITPSRPPQGWNNQVSNDLLLNYSLAVERELLSDEVSQFVLSGRARLGTVYTDAAIGMWSRFEHRPKFFTHIGPDPGRKVNFFATLGWELRFVGYDASLQGGMFNRTSPYTIPSASLSRVMVSFDTSAVLEIKKHRLRFYQNVVSPRFNKSDWHAWAGISYSYWW
jgi:hypothetical protein